jgi:hypothetical protein
MTGWIKLLPPLKEVKGWSWHRKERGRNQEGMVVILL